MQYQQLSYGSMITEVTPPLRDPPCSRIAPDGARAALGARQLALDAVGGIGLASTAI